MSRTPFADRVLPALNVLSDALKSVRTRSVSRRIVRNRRRREMMRNVDRNLGMPDGLSGYDHMGRLVPIHRVEFSPSAAPRGQLLVLPFTAAHGRQLRAFATRMAEMGFLATTIDLPGHGRSGGERGRFHIEHVLRTLGAIADHYRNRYPELPIGMVGSSWGGDLAILAALWEEHQWRQNGRPKCLDAVLAQAVITPWQRQTITRFHRGLSLLFDSRQIGTRIMRAALGRRVHVRRMFKLSDLYVNPHLRRRFVADPFTLRSYDSRSYLGYLTYLPALGPESLTIPLLLFSGQQDRLVPHGYERLVYQALRRRHSATFFTAIPDGSHGMFEEQTATVSQRAAEWFGEIFHGDRREPLEAEKSDVDRDRRFVKNAARPSWNSNEPPSRKIPSQSRT